MRQRWLLGACVGVLTALSLACVSAASAQTGGVGDPGSPPPTAAPAADPTYYSYSLGYRDLRMGMRGEDVMTLNWALRGLALGTDFSGDFQQPTDGAVRSFQAAAGVTSDGVVGQTTRKAMATHMLTQNASWYGPGFYGKDTACGKPLTKKTIGVAHKKLPCGTRVVFAHMGRWARAKVIDRGPYIPGRKWDLTQRLAKRLGTLPIGTAPVKAVVAP